MLNFQVIHCSGYLKTRMFQAENHYGESHNVVQNLGLVVALSMGLQNAPEGFLVALFLLNQGVRKSLGVAMAFLTGVIECLASVFGFFMVHSLHHSLPKSL